MKKRIWLTAAILLLSLSFAACGGAGQPTADLVLPWTDSRESSQTVSLEDVEAISDGDYAHDLTGLVAYLKDSYLLAGEPLEMSYDVLDAVSGEKYSFTFRSSMVSVELYEFDMDHLTEKAKGYLADVKENGHFTILDTMVDAEISENGKYLMIYNDGKKDDENQEQKARAVEIFKAFQENI